MDTQDLALHTTQELIEELMRRTTFLGVVVHAEGAHRTRGWHSGDRTFKVHFNGNLDTAQATRLLDTVAEYMEQNHCEG